MAATVSLASCAAFVMLVPSHVRPQREAAPEEAAAATPGGASSSASSADQASSSSSSFSSSSSSSSTASSGSKKEGGFKLSQLIKDVVGMGQDFYRMLLIISLYGMGHINEVGERGG